MNIAQDFLVEVQQVGEIVVTDIKDWAEKAENFVAAEGVAAWGAVKPIITAVTSNLWAQGLMVMKDTLTALGDAIRTGTAVNYDTVGATFLNKMEALGVTAFHTLESNVFTGVLSALITAAEAAL